MTLEEAIIHAEEIAERCAVTDGYRTCEQEHRQLAEWLKELKEMKDKMIHCRDCVWWVKQIDSLQGRCALHQMYTTGSYYCGSAERKQDDRQEQG